MTVYIVLAVIFFLLPSVLVLSACMLSSQVSRREAVPAAPPQVKKSRKEQPAWSYENAPAQVVVREGAR